MLHTALLSCWFLYSLVSFGSSAADPYVGKGNELMQAERYDEAAVQFEQALRYDDTLEETRKNLAICKFELREYRDARSLFEHLSTEKDHAVAAYYLARLDLAEGNIDSAIARLRSIDDKSGMVDRAYFLGIAYFKKASYQEAINSLQRCLELNPRDFRAHQWLARSFAKVGRMKEASQEFARTRELHEYYTQGSVAIAGCRTLLDAGKADEAWAHCRSMIETDDVDKVAAIGMLFGQMGDQRHALAAWEKAITLDPDSPEVNYNLALACFELKDMGRARHYAQIAFQLWPWFPEATVLYGTILYMVADDTEAVSVLTRAHALRPDDVNVRRLLAELQTHSKAR